jgi:hypothetical protein
VYRGEFQLPLEIFKIIMFATFEFGDDKMIKKLEACIDEFKFNPNITIELLSLNASVNCQKGGKAIKSSVDLE